jgi:uncharacterized protein (TIGR00297 family)
MTLGAQLGLGVVLSGLIAFAAYWRGSLSRSGVAGALLVGTAIFGFGGLVWGALLVIFFVLSSLLSHYKETAKADLAEKFDKGHRRDLGQTLANGGAGALLALAYRLHPDPAWLAAFVGAMATVNADTWATELGVLSRRPPRLITTWQAVERGTSGGVSGLGTLATLAGALTIGLAALGGLALDGLFGGPGLALAGWALLPAALLGGLAGSLFDSLLGATVQAIYYSARRHKETEKRIDPDGTPNTRLRGWRWLNNDGVNFVSSLAGALVGVLAWWILNK